MSERVKKDSPAYVVVYTRFGGLINFCEATGFAPTTVHNWLRSGLVPAKWREPGLSYQRHIMKMAQIAGVAMVAADFIERDK